VRVEEYHKAIGVKKYTPVTRRQSDCGNLKNFQVFVRTEISRNGLKTFVCCSSKIL